MANLNYPNFADLAIKSKDNNNDNINQKIANSFGNNFFESQIIESPLSFSIIKANIFEHEKRMP
jgi:hypothetical protein